MNKSPYFSDQSKTGPVIFVVIMLAVMTVKPASANPASANGVYQLDVTYTNGSIIAGLLSFGLSSLPTSVSATYTLGAGQPGTEPGEESDIFFSSGDVVTASVSFGDATWVSSDLESFSMRFSSGAIDFLSYAFLPVNTLTVEGPIVLNFPLTITGTHKLTGESFEYQYTQSTQTLSAVTQVLDVIIDIKPGSETNSINLASSGIVPVAIISSDTFDATTVDPTSVSLAGASVKMVGKSDKYLCNQEDINNDGLIDLVCKIYTAQFMVEEGETMAIMEAETFDGIKLRGEDLIRIIPDI